MEIDDPNTPLAPTDPLNVWQVWMSLMLCTTPFTHFATIVVRSELWVAIYHYLNLSCKTIVVKCTLKFSINIGMFYILVENNNNKNNSPRLTVRLMGQRFWLMSNQNFFSLLNSTWTGCSIEYRASVVLQSQGLNFLLFIYLL